MQEVIAIAHEAARTQTRQLVLITGVPGAGKTLVGLRVVHAHTLDDLSVERDGAKPTSPAVFLSGNGPLVEVLKYELRGAGGGGSTFVRGVMEYLRRYIPRPGLVPPEHVIVFDEAQRAFDPEMIREKHSELLGFDQGKSEPDLMIEIADRVPEWCVVIGLLASSKDKDLGRFGIANDYQSTKRVKYGPWYGDDERDAGGYSCRHLRDVVTEFGAQGLELDGVLLAWGTDFVRQGNAWSILRARGYRKGAKVKDPRQLRVNAYRVLLTRGRDGTVAFVPPLYELDETYGYLLDSGFRDLSSGMPLPDRA